MTLVVNGERLALKDATYGVLGDGNHQVFWDDARFTWADGDTVDLQMLLVNR